MKHSTIKALRLSRAWSQEQLAELSSLSVRTVQRIENGGQASLETLSAIAAAFDLNVADLNAEMAPEATQDEALNQKIEQAKKRLDKEYGFYRAVMTWAVICAGLAAINLFTAHEQYWFIWPTAIWGALLAVRGIKLFVLHGWLERRQQQRLQKLLRK
ncbi:2TM domain-containing protein [Enterobacteriaceae bacterium H20N1]|uniref:2TM domain-containing protein n=1 Tax=Dryocola boscaweniae TaxID=2925397 RepID=A0A9X2W633_9ENTR|nr:2TM domain-containing protein [Dryocola boscaweniae]MCT4701723.1 2TM domain-containing protein [Dryocola boscaweniae]MCT4718892.1 2TM domain-containing protein [Dryocola boscaweniae]